jgi:transcriptional regulator with XRE-family HTH domain
VKTFATAVRAARVQRGLSQHQAADATGIHFRTLQRMESGQFDCNRRNAVALIQYYGLPAETMLLP